MSTRTKIAAAGAAVVLLVTAACGANSGTASVASTTPSSSSSAASSVSSSAMSSSSAETSSSEASSSDSSSSDSSSSSDTSVSATTTIGGTGTLDDASKVWFSTFCGGIAPLKDLASMGSSSMSAGGVKAIGSKIAEIGVAFTTTSENLKALPPPGFDGGSEFATKAEAALTDLGGKFTKAGQEVSTSGNISSLDSISTDMQSGPAKDLSAIQATPETKAQIAALPACKDLGIFSN